MSQPPKYELPPPPPMFPTPPRAAAPTGYPSPPPTPQQQQYPQQQPQQQQQYQYPPPPRQQQQQQQQHQSRPSTDPSLTPEQRERERIAEEAIMVSLQHTVQRYVEQRAAERLGLTEEPGAAVESAMRRGLEFHPNIPRHNWHMIAALAVTYFGLLPMMGAVTLTVGLLGIAAVYISDYLGYRKGSILVLLGAISAFQGMLLLTNMEHLFSSLGGLLAVLNTFVVAAVVTCNVVIQYHWMQVTFPELVAMLERLVLLLAPLSMLPSLLSTCIALAGSRIGVFPFAVCCCAVQYFFASRKDSSFLRMSPEEEDTYTNAEDRDSRGNNSRNNNINSDGMIVLSANTRMDAALVTLVTSLAPTIASLMITSDPHQDPALLCMNVLTLLGANMLYLIHDPEELMWFLKPTKNTLMGVLHTDPLGLWCLLLQYRPYLLLVGMLLAMEGLTYRILHSRYQYLFLGVPKPLNGILMVFCMFFVVIIAFMIMREIKKKENAPLHPHQLSTERVMIMLLSIAVAIIMALVSGMPMIFHPMSAMCVVAFNLHLIDRFTPSYFMLFMFSSTIMLMWWMFRTFSFVEMDLRILTDATVVPVAFLTITVLFCYILGALSFYFSFSKENYVSFGMKATFFLLSLKVGVVEHILYSQRDTGAYPGILVFITSIAGSLTTMRMYHNGLLNAEAAALTVGSYLAKLYIFLCEQAGMQYLLDSSSSLDEIRGLLLTLSWICAVGAGSLLTILEIKHQKKQLSKDRTSDIIRSFAVMVFAALLLSHRNLTRAFVETITGKWRQLEYQMDLLLGGTFVLASVSVALVMIRYTRTSPLRECGIPFTIGAGLIIINPLAIIGGENLTLQDGSYNTTPLGRAASLVALLLIVGARFISFARCSALLRYIYWGTICGCVSAAMYFILYPAATITFIVAIFIFCTFTAIVIDMCHYREVGMEAWVVYAASIAAMVLAFLSGNTDIGAIMGPEASQALVWQMHDNMRMVILSVGAVTSMLVAVLVKFRLSGHPLLPRPVAMTDDMVQHVGVIGNYSTLLATCMMLIMNTWAGEASLPMYIFISTFLLMLVDDGILFYDLGRGSFRYFPMLASILGSFWALLGYSAYGVYTKASLGSAIAHVLYAAPVVPSHLSLLWLLYHGTKKGGAIMGSVLAFVVIDFFCIFFASRPIIQWMAIVGITGQMVRLYASQFWSQSMHTVL